MTAKRSAKGNGARSTSLLRTLGESLRLYLSQLSPAKSSSLGIWVGIVGVVVAVAIGVVQLLSQKPDGNAAAGGTVRYPVATATVNGEAVPVYVVKLFVPTQHRGVSVLVDGRPAEVIKALPSLIEIRVQRKDSPTEFTLQGGHLKEAIRFTLFIEHNNFEYSPFQ